MQSNQRRKTLCAALAVVLIACIALFLFTKTMLFLPKGELLSSVPSPDQDRVVDVYLCNGGATVDYAVRCAIRGQGLIRRNIYWQYHAKDADVHWLDNDTVSINGIFLDAKRGRYDYRD